jgi:hypothetical protein
MSAFVLLGRRFLVLAALMYWLGGFTFYAAVVVPVGTEVLRSPRRQGFITRKVTRDLNVTAAVALAVLAVEVVASGDPSRQRWWARLLLWSFMAGCQAALFVLHAHLDSFLVERGGIVLDHEAFRPWHRLYLWLHTAQWAAALAFIGLVLVAWRVRDRAAGHKEARGNSETSGL